MKLPDFHQSDDFNQLRQTMNKAELGEFELFDPRRHLTWQERQQLENGWISIESNYLHAYADKSLAYKNSYVFTCTNEKLHFALCDHLHKLTSTGRLPQVDVTLSKNIIQAFQVCEYCLHAVNYQGFDVYRHRHQAYNDKILKSFSLSNYLSHKLSN